MPLAISLLMGTWASPDCHKWQPPSVDHRSAIASTDAGSSAHRTKNTAKDWMEWKTDIIGKEKIILCGADILICNKNRNLDLRRSDQNQQEKICCHKRETVVMSNFNKYYYAMKSQYSNISVLKLKQLSKTNQSECDVVCNHSMIDYCGGQLMTAMKCSPPQYPKIEKGGLSTRKVKSKNIVNDLKCCKSFRLAFTMSRKSTEVVWEDYPKITYQTTKISFIVNTQ